ncbi:hypothetical protein EIP86_008971 [Pleurotus ostreatoroseus]|nr:hypothetical protein EIP86_008971 [Pleurotus ostreatoroseus]
MTLDPTTQANYTQIASEHIDFDWSIDFGKKLILGSATHTLVVKEADVKEVIFDTNALDIEGVEVDGTAVKHVLGPKHEVMGSALHVTLSNAPTVGSKFKATIRYKTTDGCTALQWLDKE